MIQEVLYSFYHFIIGFDAFPEIFFPKFRNGSQSHGSSSSYIARVHDLLLRRALRGERYLKLYSYHYLINGFAVLVTPQQVSFAKPYLFSSLFSSLYHHIHKDCSAR